MAVEPAGDGRHQRCENSAPARSDQNAIEELKLLDGGSSACRYQTDAQKGAAGQQNNSRAEPVHHHAPAEAGDAHRNEVERHRRRNRGARPAGRDRHGLQEHGQRKDRADRDTTHERASGNDDPAIVRVHGAAPASYSSWRRTQSVRLPRTVSLRPFGVMSSSAYVLSITSPPRAKAE